jgi:hypothetical protein
MIDPYGLPMIVPLHLMRQQYRLPLVQFGQASSGKPWHARTMIAGTTSGICLSRSARAITLPKEAATGAPGVVSRITGG